jgi:hypothetical protein
MDYITLVLIGLGFAAGCWCGSRYRSARVAGKTRMQSLIVIQGGGGPPPVR